MRKVLLLAALVLTFATSAMAQRTTLESVKKLDKETTRASVSYPNSKEASEIFKVIAALPKLTSLTVNSNSSRSTWFAPLASNKTITEIRFTGSMSIRDADLVHFTKMTQLTSYRDNAE